MKLLTVTQRHLARSLEAQDKSSTATIVGMLGAILLTIARATSGDGSTRNDSSTVNSGKN